MLQPNHTVQPLKVDQSVCKLKALENVNSFR